MLEVIFLFALTLIWIIFAVVQDSRTTEIANWLNFSLIVFALGFRFFYSLFSESMNFFYQGVFGLLIFFALGNALYYVKMFAGGDAKLFVALGAALPLSYSFIANLYQLSFFLIIFFFVGALYSIMASLVICFRHFSSFKKEFRKQLREKKKIVGAAVLIAIILAVGGFIFDVMFIYLAIVAFVIPYLYLYAKAVDEAAMIKEIDSTKLREGDWLYKDIRIGKTVIKANWDGLNMREIALLKRHKNKVVIRQGVPFTGAFIVSVLAYFYLNFIDYRIF